MTKISLIENQLSSLFARQSCWMIKPLAIELNYSVPSVRRFLSKTGYYSSFTHNGKWYTLNLIPRFNRDGLWFHNKIGFSRVGSLTKTLIALTQKSPGGKTAEQLGEKLRCRCHTILIQLCRKKKLQRIKTGRSFIYYAADPHIADRQRQVILAHPLPAGQLPAEIAVIVLAEYIRNPEADFEQLAQAVTSYGKVTIEVAQIEKLFRT